MRRGLLLTALFLSACGGGADLSGSGGSVSGFYSLSLSLNQAEITSPAVQVNIPQGAPPEVSLPEDTFSGRIGLVYSGSLNTPMRGAVQSARLCLQTTPERCYNLPISGVLTAGGQPLQFNVSLSDYKTGLPWIAVNPFEDMVLNTAFQNIPLTGASTPANQNDTYLNAQRTINLNQVPVQAGSVEITANGVFSGQTGATTSAGGGLTLTLPKGINSANVLVAGQVSITAGAVTCTDDGAGGFNAPCNGTVNYATGAVNVVGGLPANTQATVSYRINGQLRCFDNASGGFTGDCTPGSSINYGTGQLTYAFVFNAVNTPQAVQINYSRAVAVGNSVRVSLPPPTVVAPYVYRVSGRVIEVYQGPTKLCDRAGGQCGIAVSGNEVQVTFQGQVPQNLTLRYSQEEKIDINPAYDALQSGTLPSASVPAQIEVRVRLESGETLTARTSINFRVVPTR